MRASITTAAIILAALAFSPVPGTAAQPSHGMSHPDGEHGWHGGHGWNHWHTGHGYYNSLPYAVGSPIVQNPPPVPSGGPITILNPVGSGAPLTYTLNGMQYTIQPGQSQQLTEDRAWVINFSRGPNFGSAQYGLHGGQYTFGVTDHGWELFSGVPASTTTVAPPAAAPGNGYASGSGYAPGSGYHSSSGYTPGTGAAPGTGYPPGPGYASGSGPTSGATYPSGSGFGSGSGFPSGSGYTPGSGTNYPSGSGFPSGSTAGTGLQPSP